MTAMAAKGYVCLYRLFATARRASTTLISLMALMALLELCSQVLLHQKRKWVLPCK